MSTGLRGAAARLRHGRRLDRSRGGDVLMALLILLIAAVMVLPLIYAVVNAIKPIEEFYLFPPRFFTAHPTADNFLDLFALAADSWVPFSRYVFNSVCVSVLTTGLYVVLAGMCAYVLSKHEFCGKKTLNRVIVLSMLFTSTIMSIPQYVILSKLGMIDTFLVITVPALGSTMGCSCSNRRSTASRTAYWRAPGWKGAASRRCAGRS